MKKLLAVSWVMPPLVFPRAIQVGRTLKGLSSRGWQVDVVTSTPVAIEDAHRDDRLGLIYNSFYKRHLIDFREEVEASSVATRVERRLLSRNFHWSLNEDNWRRRAVKRASDLIRKEKPDVLVTFAQPWVDHVVGVELKKMFSDLPWVAHFSDPWSDSILLDADDVEMKNREIALEKRVVEAADALVFTTRQTKDLVLKKYPAGMGRKAHVVLHASDEDLVAHLRPEGRGDARMRMVHAGSLYEGKRSPIEFLEVLVSLRREDPDILRNVRVEFVGREPESLRDYVKRRELNDIVKFRGQKAYFDSLNIMAEADWLLLFDIVDEEGVFLPSKIADYLMFSRPVIFFTPKRGAVSELATDLGCLTIEPTNVGGSRDLLRRILEGDQSEIAGSVPATNPLTFADVVSSFEHVLAQAMGKNRND